MQLDLHPSRASMKGQGHSKSRMDTKSHKVHPGQESAIERWRARGKAENMTGIQKGPSNRPAKPTVTMFLLLALWGQTMA